MSGIGMRGAWLRDGYVHAGGVVGKGGRICGREGKRRDGRGLEGVGWRLGLWYVGVGLLRGGVVVVVRY